MTVAWIDLNPGQRMLLIWLGFDTRRQGSIGTEMARLRSNLQRAVPSMRPLGLVMETRSSHVGVWLQMTRAGLAVREQGRIA